MGKGNGFGLDNKSSPCGSRASTRVLYYERKGMAGCARALVLSIAKIQDNF